MNRRLLIAALKGPLYAAILFLAASPLSAATLDGMKIHSTVTGKGAKTIVLVHGWTCDDTSWAANIPELARHYRVITLDLPGHGQSGAPKDGKVTTDMFAKAVEAVRAEQKVDKIILVGHSMGTPVIRQYAHLYPQHVSALVLVDGVVVAPLPPGAQVQTPLDPKTMSAPDGLATRERFIRGMFTPKTPKDVQEHVLKMMLAAPPATAESAMRTTFDQAYASDEVMTVPAYGIFAEKSFAIGAVPFLKKVLPKLEYVEMPGTGHFVMMEQPQEFNRLLMKFVESL